MIARPKVSLVADNAALQAAAVAACAEAGFSLETFRSVEELLPACDFASNRCLIIDLQLASSAGLDLQRQLRDGNHRLAIVAVCARGDVSSAVEAMRLGALTVIENPCSSDRLRQEMEQAIRDHDVQLRRETIQVDVLRRLARLTAKERDVVDLILAGKTNKGMAAELQLSLRGVEDRRARVMKKLQVESVPHLISLVRMAEGWRSK